MYRPCRPVVQPVPSWLRSSQDPVGRRQCLTSKQLGTVKHQELQFPHNQQRREKQTDRTHTLPRVCTWVSLASVIRPVISALAGLISLFKFNEEGELGGAPPRCFQRPEEDLLRLSLRGDTEEEQRSGDEGSHGKT
ncbi:hypothetical protein SRHO_G00062640 [Serrasalmus rhombeus]